MTTSRKQVNGNARTWLRRSHRWLGIAAALFVLLLSVTGIALNHSSDWRLDRRYVSWDWAIDALGVHTPEPSVSFADNGHRVTQIGERTYFDACEIGSGMESLGGLVMLDTLFAIASGESVILLTADGELVQRFDVSAELPGTIERIGRADGRPVLESGGDYFIGDADATAFDAWPDGAEATVAWSSPSEPSRRRIAVLKEHYRGRGLTVERLLIEIHSGRILAAAAPLVLDVVAAGLILLSISGLYVWMRSRGNGAQGQRR